MNELIHFNQDAFKTKKAKYEKGLGIVQGVIDAYDKLKFPKLAGSDFYRLFIEPEDLMFDKMTEGKEVSIAGLKLNKKKALEILSVPPQFEDLKKCIEVAKKELLSTCTSEPVSINSNELNKYFELNEKGDAALKAHFINSLEIDFQLFAKSDKAKKILEFVRAVKEKYLELGIDELHGDIRSLVADCFYEPSQYHEDDCMIDPKGITKYNSA